MCTKIDVLFSNNRVVRVWYGILVNTAGFNNNEACSNVWWQGSKLQHYKLVGGVCEFIGKCTHGHNLSDVITKDNQKHKRPNITRSIRHEV